MAPLVSVVIPTFNNARLIGETLAGVRTQTFRNFETIIVDDGSNDETAAVVARYDPTIHYVYQSNQGPAAARNKGVSLAKGKYIAFCDHDDIWNERHLESLCECFSHRPSVGLAFDNAEYFGERSVCGRVHIDAYQARCLKRGTVTARDLLLVNPITSMSNVMVATKVFKALGGLSEKVGVIDDFHFYLRVASHEVVVYVDYVGVRKRTTESNLSKSVNIKENNVLYLEDILQTYPEVIDAIGPLHFRLRLARKYFKLGRFYSQNKESALAAEMFWKAYAMNVFNLRYLLYYAMLRKAR